MATVLDQSSAVVTRRNIIGGRHSDEGEPFDVVASFTGKVATRAWAAPPTLVDKAVKAAMGARAAVAAPSGYERAAILRRAQAGILNRLDEIAVAITRETGKTIRDTREEVRRASGTIGLCAEEAIGITGEQVPMDGTANGAGKLAMLLRFPVGVVAAIVPFNAPFNVTCHKLGPALAAGNAIVIKAPPEAPSCVELAVELFLEAGMPAEGLTLLHGKVSTGETLVRHPGVNFITVTGSTRGGLAVREAAGMRRVLLELGGSARTSFAPTLVVFNN